jgi:phage terminase large subunit-like protein
LSFPEVCVAPTPEELQRLISKLSLENRGQILKEGLAYKSANAPRPWETLPAGDGGARPKQLPPEHPRHHMPWTNPKNGQTYRCSDYNPHCTGISNDWTTWIFLAGRGTGKTMAGAQWCLAMALSEPGIYVGVCAPTYAAVQRVCFEDLQSGIRSLAQPGEIVDYNRNNLTIRMRNGSIIQGFTAEKEDSVRGANLSYCWFDELAMIKYHRFYDYGLKPALRVKPKFNEPRLMITTTPKKMRLLRELLKQAGTDPAKIHITRARSEENPKFAEGALEDLRRTYKGTYLERQELEGELIEEADGALFRIEDFSEFRIEPGDEPKFRRIVVAIDPATTSSEASDETGIAVAAEGIDHHFYTLEDCSMRANPERCMQAVAAAYHRWDADLVIGEKQGVGDYMREALAKVDPNIPFKSIPVMKGKLIRAQSVSILASQGRIHMVGADFDALEEQLASMTPDDDRSQMHDDRADAWVWAMRELTGQGAGSFKEMYGFIPCAECGEDINEQLETKCRHCGYVLPEKQVIKQRDRSTRWSSAYMKICDKGHEFPMRLDRCPQCNMDPGVYLAQAMKLSGKTGQWHSYAGRNWFTAGRRT